MNLKQSFVMAIKSLMSSKMRSFLTMLGIIIGVAAVIILVGLMNGMTNSVLETFESMGTNLITVNIRGRGGNRTVTTEQMMALIDENPDLISGISPNVTTNATVKVGTESDDTTCYGVNEYYKSIRSVELSQGRFLEYIDVERRQKNCVIGSYIAENYFGGTNPVGQQMKIGGNTYTVIGVVEEGADSEEGSSDDVIYIPYTLARNLAWNSFVSNYLISAVDNDTVDGAAEKVEKLLLSVYSSSDYYSMMKMSEMMETVNDITGQMTMLLVGIAGISLLVGGIGIMNIMLVSVTERTREIGIRKSLGARRRDIMSQFVVEAATSSAVGGMLGIILGIAGAYGLGNLIDLKAAPSFGSIMLAFGVSVGIGIIFGYSPASKASKLNPIDALRYD